MTWRGRGSNSTQQTCATRRKPSTIFILTVQSFITMHIWDTESCVRNLQHMVHHNER